MRIRRMLMIGAAATVLALGWPQTEVSQAAEATHTKLTKCPKGFSKHKDDLGQTWCMDSEGRNYTPENAEYVAKMKRGH